MFFDSIFLTNTDTTIGFVSKDSGRLYDIKNRDKAKSLITVCSLNKTLITLTRVPMSHKKLVRNSQKTTFIFPKKDISIRVIKNSPHSRLIDKLKIAYSTSANISNMNFDILWAKKVSDIIVYDKKELKQKAPSTILKLYKTKIKKLR